MSAFDQLAPEYDVSWTNSEHGRAQRDVVWRELDVLFKPGDRVLDLGCGTGEDALHLMSRGVEVHAIDASTEMIRVARERGLPAQQLRIEELSRIQSDYDGALSNFGALNCVEDLTSVGSNLARLIRPGGILVVCIMPRLAWGELLRCNFRRWRSEVYWRGMRIYYPTDRALAKAFCEFRLVRRISIARRDHSLSVWRRVDP